MSVRIRKAPSTSFILAVAVCALVDFCIEADGDSWLVGGVGLDVVLKPSGEEDHATRGGLGGRGRCKWKGVQKATPDIYVATGKYRHIFIWRGC